MKQDDEADRWFYDLGAVAKRVEANEKRAAATARRQYVVAAFMLFAFLLLAWRSEVNASRIDRNTQRITTTQHSTCQGSLEILRKFNNMLDSHIAIERTNPFVDDHIRAARIAAYQKARITPLPVCREDGTRG